MARSQNPNVSTNSNADTPVAWEVIQEETGLKVIFDTVGDSFTGIKVRNDTIEFADKRTGEVQSFNQYLFRTVPDDGHVYAINESYKLRALANIQEGMMVRITFTHEVPVGQPSDMRDFKIEVSRS